MLFRSYDVILVVLEDLIYFSIGRVPDTYVTSSGPAYKPTTIYDIGGLESVLRSRLKWMFEHSSGFAFHAPELDGVHVDSVDEVMYRQLVAFRIQCARPAVDQGDLRVTPSGPSIRPQVLTWCMEGSRG